MSAENSAIGECTSEVWSRK